MPNDQVEVTVKPRRRKKAASKSNGVQTSTSCVLVKLPPETKVALAIRSKNEMRSQNAQAAYYIMRGLESDGMLVD